VEVPVAGVESRLVKVANCVPVGLTVAKTGDSSEVTVVPLPLPLLVATLLPPLLPLPLLLLLVPLLLLDGLAVATTDCVDICEPDEPSNPATSIPKAMKDWVFPLSAVANEFSPSVAMTSLLSSVPANAPETGVRVMVAATAQRRNVVANAAPVIYPPFVSGAHCIQLDASSCLNFSPQQSASGHRRRRAGGSFDRAVSSTRRSRFRWM